MKTQNSPGRKYEATQRRLAYGRAELSEGQFNELIEFAQMAPGVDPGIIQKLIEDAARIQQEGQTKIVISKQLFQQIQAALANYQMQKQQVDGMTVNRIQAFSMNDAHQRYTRMKDKTFEFSEYIRLKKKEKDEDDNKRRFNGGGFRTGIVVGGGTAVGAAGGGVIGKHLGAAQGKAKAMKNADSAIAGDPKYKAAKESYDTHARRARKISKNISKRANDPNPWKSASNSIKNESAKEFLKKRHTAMRKTGAAMKARADAIRSHMGAKGAKEGSFKGMKKGIGYGALAGLATSGIASTIMRENAKKKEEARYARGMNKDGASKFRGRFSTVENLLEMEKKTKIPGQ